jgi:hypothetical protein
MSDTRFKIYSTHIDKNSLTRYGKPLYSVSLLGLNFPIFLPSMAKNMTIFHRLEKNNSLDFLNMSSILCAVNASEKGS